MGKTKSNGMDTDSMQMSFEIGRFSHPLYMSRVYKHICVYILACSGIFIDI